MLCVYVCVCVCVFYSFEQKKTENKGHCSELSDWRTIGHILARVSTVPTDPTTIPARAAATNALRLVSGLEPE